ncbi:SnoaL-like domain [Mycobacteroides abscessus subsp. bolletii]|uniref:nuclear transport factor 2 family protein n=1 Tax=Mycobacteroides abscessus TaxID=36809 RepID=UPI000927BC2F|nr:nuclear transport factor 2 family protein [Mycobacteroides abscessus]SIJ30583.1 SnoaL-like domain [Mycobacteroides abscessus subsp. bolletii]SLF73370.1 SnoaL-like domain [Mycobacteroides abscessus subsp. bolletii]
MSHATSATPHATTKAHILELEDARYRAVIDRDFETFRRLCHPDLVYTHSDSARDTLDSYIDKCQSGFYTYSRIDHPVDDVLIVGGTVVVVGRMSASITAGGAPKELNNNSIAVWVKSADSWLLLAYQPTPLKTAH